MTTPLAKTAAEQSRPCERRLSATFIACVFQDFQGQGYVASTQRQAEPILALRWVKSTLNDHSLLAASGSRATAEGSISHFRRKYLPDTPSTEELTARKTTVSAPWRGVSSSRFMAQAARWRHQLSRPLFLPRFVATPPG